MGQVLINTIGYPATVSNMLEPSGNVVSMRSATAPAASQFKLWPGMSGKHYAHTVYPLVSCPEVPKCTYRLVKSAGNGQFKVLETGTLENDAPSLNLAKLRQTAARLGATEVHIHFLAQNREDRDFVAEDMAAEQSH